MIPKQYFKFPPSRYMGSKNKVIKELHDLFSQIEFKSAIDLFSGSSSVSYLLKSMGKKVFSNDFMNYCSNISKAIIENSNTKLEKKDIDFIFQIPKKYDRFVSLKFKDLYFSNSDNDLIDICRHNISKIKDEYKRSIALASLSKACQKKRSRGIFTYVGLRYDDGRNDLKKSLEDHILDSINVFNLSVFDNQKKCKSYNEDFLKFNKKADLIYIDPPYFSPLSDNDYIRRYHFLEGLSKNWEGLKIQEDTKTKKFKKYPSLFDTKIGSYKAIELLIQRYIDRIIVFSYSSNSLPNEKEIKNIAKKYKKNCKTIKVNHTYSFGNQRDMNKNKNKVNEYFFLIK